MFKCKICGKNFTELSYLYSHIEKEHASMIPKDMCVQQYYYYMKTGKMNGNCVMCKKPTTWNMNTGKYNRFCGDPKCKDEYVKIMKSRMVAKYGKTHLLNDPNKQREMLANRSISGTYTWSDGKHESTYTGSYELDFLKTLDGFFDWDPEDISMPSPHTYTYRYNGEDKFYIPDVYIHSLELEIEIKDGGDNPNNHHKIQDVDKEKERLKDEVMCSQKAVHYIKITNKNYENLFRFLKEIKKEFEKYGDEKKIPRIFKIEDIKGTKVKPIKESGFSDIVIDDIEKIKAFNNKKYSDNDLFFSISYDLAKNNPKELHALIHRLIKGARHKEDFHYIAKLVKKSNDQTKKLLRRRPELKDDYDEYFNWVNHGGMEGMIKKRKRDLKIKENYEIIDESYLRNKKDLYVNFEAFDSGKVNICLVTGLSGSGKSTLSDNLCKQYKATSIELDKFEHPDMEIGPYSSNKVYNNYFNSRQKLRTDLINNNLSNNERATEMTNALIYAIDYCNKHPEERFIIEGLQIFADIDPEHVKGLPIVFVNTSMINSMIRKVKRDNHKYKVADLFEWYIEDEKKFNNFKDEVLEEKFEPDKFLVWFDKPIQKLKGGKINVYHGSSVKMNGTVKPISPNVGATKYSDPRWSTYVWDNREDAIAWASAWAVKDVVGARNICYVGHNNKGKTMIAKPDDMTNKEFMLYLIEKVETFYVYEFEIDIDELEIGSCPTIREYTVSNPMKISRTFEYKLNKEIFRRCFEIVSFKELEEFEKSMFSSKLEMPKHRNMILNNLLKTCKDPYRNIIRTEVENGNAKPGDDISFLKYSINRHFKNDTYGFLESYMIYTMEESSISIPQMSLYLQNEYEEEMRNYLNTYKKYYNLMLKEQPSAVEHINEDIRKCLIVIDDLAAKGVENNLVQFAKDDLGEIVKASKKGKPVKVIESMVEDMVNINDNDSINSITVQGDNVSIYNEIIECKLVYSNSNSKRLFSLNDTSSKLIIENSYVVQRDKVGSHCSITPYYKDMKEENVLEFTIKLGLEIDVNDLEYKLTEGVNITNLYKFDDDKFEFIRESCLKLFGVYPEEINIK